MAMPKDDVRGGTAPPRKKRRKTGTSTGGGGQRKPGAGRGKGSDRVSGVLNPGFDPRMRGVGSPLNLSHKIKRGWIQSGPYETTKNRVNFLFNPSQVDVSSSIDPTRISGKQKAQNPADPTQMLAVGDVSNIGVSLLYDRTYEMFSTVRSGMAVTANQYGVYADVMAWYYFLKMIDELPSGPTYERVGGKLIHTVDWAKTTFVSPMQLVNSYLYVGPRMMFYGFVNSINVTYSHFSQHMIPIRCKVDIGFSVVPDLPTAGSNANGTKKKTPDRDIGSGVDAPGWNQDWNGANLFNTPTVGSSGIGTPGTIIGPGGQVIRVD